MEKAVRSYDEIMSDALALPPEQRESLAEQLMDSLAPLDQEQIDALWALEAERRFKEIQDGTVKPIPGDEVMSRLKSRYKR